MILVGLIKKISKALKDVGGASSEYQGAVLELRQLEHVLRELETLEPTEDNASHVNAIRGMALACQLPLRDFMIKLEKYEASLGPFAKRQLPSGAVRKTQWATTFVEEVDKLRAVVAAKSMSINLLLAVHVS